MFIEGYSRLFSFSSVKIPYLALAVSLIDALTLFFLVDTKSRLVAKLILKA